MTQTQTIFTSAKGMSDQEYTPAPQMILTDQAGNWRPSVIKRLEELLRLENGWDGYNGIPISLENAIFALRMLEAVCTPETPAPQIIPGADGDLQIEWHTLQGDLELHVQAPNKVEAWFCRTGQDSEGEERPLTFVFYTVAEWVKIITETPIASSATTT